jgi:acylphosphatase
MVENDTYRMHIRVNGRVQGVGFRWFVLTEARRRGLRGWVRNNRDGSVELEAEGPAADMAALRARASAGPPAARVANVIELPVSNDTLPEPFDIGR